MTIPSSALRFLTSFWWCCMMRRPTIWFGSSLRTRTAWKKNDSSCVLAIVCYQWRSSSNWTVEGCKRGPTLGRLTCCCHSCLKVAGLGAMNNVLVHSWVSYRAKSFMRISISVCLYGRRINLSVVNMSAKQLPKGCRGLGARSCLMRIPLLDHVALVLTSTQAHGTMRLTCYVRSHLQGGSRYTHVDTSECMF